MSFQSSYFSAGSRYGWHWISAFITRCPSSGEGLDVIFEAGET